MESLFTPCVEVFPPKYLDWNPVLWREDVVYIFVSNWGPLCHGPLQYLKQSLQSHSESNWGLQKSWLDVTNKINLVDTRQIPGVPPFMSSLSFRSLCSLNFFSQCCSQAYSWRRSQWCCWVWIGAMVFWRFWQWWWLQGGKFYITRAAGRHWSVLPVDNGNLLYSVHRFFTQSKC